jgi:anaerobic ribonucleoside-triphosphate reductase activating protein
MKTKTASAGTQARTDNPMTEITLAIVDRKTGRMVVDTENPAVARAAAAELPELESVEMGCANPVQVLHPNPSIEQPAPHVRINGFWHDSFVEGPGRRSVVRFQGCPIRCAGCWVPFTHDPNGGYKVNIDWLADALLDPKYERDGVTIVGGEPFWQPAALARLLVELRSQQPNLNVVVYSGFTYEALRAQTKQNGFEFVFDLFGTLIDGQYVKSRAHHANCGCGDEVRRYTGSCNQRIIRLH